MEFGRDMDPAARPQRRVLMLAAAFPPTGGAGVQRSAKFAKYLPRYGWLPTVWTIDRIDALPQDETLLADLPSEVTIHRWRQTGAMRSLHRSVQRHGDGRGVAASLARSMDWRLAGWLSRRPWPDDYAAWARSSVDPLRRIIADEGVDAIYSTYSPASNHLLALLLRSQTRLPWVADFRDLWTDDLRYEMPSNKRHRANVRLEHKFLATADAVVGVTPRQTAILATHVPNERGKFATITNGFDPDDFKDEPEDEARKQDRFVLAFVGRFDKRRADDVLLAGLEQFVRQLGDRRDRFLFRLVGHASRTTLDRLRAIRIMHVFTGYVPHATAVREMVSANALLISTESTGANAGSVINGKLFEYLASGRPILVVGPERGECERIVQSRQAGLTVGFDKDAIAGALRTLFEAWNAGKPRRGCDPARLDAFSRVAQARNLASVLDRVVDAGAGEIAPLELLEEVGAV